jgi:hypothetical protein
MREAGKVRKLRLPEISAPTDRACPASVSPSSLVGLSGESAKAAISRASMAGAGVSDPTRGL